MITLIGWLLTVSADAAPYGPPYYGQPYYGQPYYGQPYYGPPTGQPYAPAVPQGSPQGEAPRFRPVPPTNAQGVPPSYQPAPAQGWMPDQRTYPRPGYPSNWPPGYPQLPAQAASSAPPRLDWSLDEPAPYLQQAVILRLELVSRDNLSTANLELPPTSDVLLKEIEGPKTSSRTTPEGRREIVNSFLVSLMPLRTGQLELPPLRVTGQSGNIQHFEAVTERRIQLQVRPAMHSVRPWLPLKSLTLNASIDREESLMPGQPVTLALELAAVGGAPTQLPTLEGQLTSPDFRIYREQTLTDSGVSPDGRQLTARRTEYYTLVPQSSGRLALPEIAVPWWNVDRGTREVASLPIRVLAVGDVAGPFGLSVSSLLAAGAAWRWIWLPLVGLALLLAGYWAGVFYRGGGLRTGGAYLAVLGRRFGRDLGRLLTHSLQAVGRLSPVLARAGMRALPPSSRFLGCVRHANRASNPADWCERFEQAARHRLRFQGEVTQTSMTDQILRLRPGADRATLARLMAQLDAALYGRQTMDFARWKRDFMRQVGRGAGLLRPRRDRSRIKWAALPALNPTHG